MQARDDELAGLVACASCDLLMGRPEPAPGEIARCPRCRQTIARGRRGSLDRSLSFALAALVCLAIAQTFPLLHLSSEGRSHESTISDGAVALAAEGQLGLALFVFAASVVFPALRVTGLVCVLGPLRFGRGRGLHALAGAYRRLEQIAPWAMLEVYLLGLLVAFVKLGDVADVAAGTALYGFVAFIAFATAAGAALDPELVFGALHRRKERS